MGCLFFNLSIYIVVFFSLSLTCFSLDEEKGGELGNGGMEGIEMTPVESECTGVTLNENTEEKNVNSSIKLNNCCSKKNVLIALKILLTSFFLGGISYDESLRYTFVRRSEKGSILTSLFMTVFLCVLSIISKFVFKFENCDVFLTILGVYIFSVVLYIFGEFWQYFLVKKLGTGKIDESYFLFYVAMCVRVFSALMLAFFHASFMTLCAVNSPDGYIWTSVILASCFSLFLFFCNILTYYKEKWGIYIFEKSCLLISHAAVSFAQAEIVLSMILFVLSKDKPMACIFLSIFCYILMSFSSFFHVKNAKKYPKIYQELKKRNAIKLEENSRLNEEHNNNDNINDTPITEETGVAISVEELSTA